MKRIFASATTLLCLGQFFLATHRAMADSPTLSTESINSVSEPLSMESAPAPSPENPWVAISWRDGSSLLPAVLDFDPVSPLPTGIDPLSMAIEQRLGGRPSDAARILSDWFAGRLDGLHPLGSYRYKLRGRFLLGWLYKGMGMENLASENFTKARLSVDSLAEYAAWYEARADFLRGRHQVAARECRHYRQEWPEGRFSMDCLLLMGEAYTASGYRDPAILAFQEYIQRYPEHPDQELARLGMARATANRNVEAGLRQLSAISLNYSYPTTRTAALIAIEELSGQDMKSVQPENTQERIQLASSALRAKQTHLAWELFRQIRQASFSDPGLTDWVESNLSRFRWRTRQYPELVSSLIREYESAPDGETCWQINRALARGGYWADAAKWGERGLHEHSSHRRWRHAHENVALALTNSGQYTQAAAMWDRLGRTGGNLGGRARWMAAYTTFKAGNLDEADKRLREVIASDSRRATRASYYRARLLSASGDPEAASRAYAGLLAAEPNDWYSMLARARLGLSSGNSHERTGFWPAPIPPDPSPPEPTPIKPVHTLADPRASHLLPAKPSSSFNWAFLRWMPGASTAAQLTREPEGHGSPTAPTPPSWGEESLDAPPETGSNPLLPPNSYEPGPYFDPASARPVLASFVAAHASTWNLLPTALALADAGVYELASEIIGRVYEDVEEALANSSEPASHRVYLPQSSWRQIFLYTHDHHHGSRFCMGMDKYASDDESRRQALRLAYPAAFAQYVWPEARANDLDPLFTTALMRQESLYCPWALSRTGARGVMQIMPTTGALIANDLGLLSFSTRSLENPIINIQYGSWYLGRLMKRFHGSLPMAAAAYNAGPHNVHAWFRDLYSTLEIDDLVEQIPVDETRNYVRRVMAFYARYVSIYAAPGSFVNVDLRVEGDDPTVIDY